MTWLEWCYFSSGVNKSKIKEWEHTRQISWMIYKANSDPKKSSNNMLNWWKLPTDEVIRKKIEKPKGRLLTKKQMLDFFNQMK